MRRLTVVSRHWDNGFRDFRTKFIPFVYLFEKAEYNLSSSTARDAIRHWAHEVMIEPCSPCLKAVQVFEIDVNFCGAIADGSMRLHDGLLYARAPIEPGGDHVTTMILTKEQYKNPNGTILGYGTDWPHISRKVPIESCTSHPLRRRMKATKPLGRRLAI
jgi:hypothetical protein